MDWNNIVRIVIRDLLLIGTIYFFLKTIASGWMSKHLTGD